MNTIKTLLCASAGLLALAGHHIALAEDCPADVADLTPGHWCEVPNSNMDELDPCPARDCPYTGSLGIRGVMGAWGGAAYDTTSDRLLVTGGGHSDYFGNEVYAFDVNAQTWSRLTDPSVVDTSTASEQTGLNPDGTPRSRHSRNSLVFSPELNSLVMVGAAGTYPSACCGDQMVHALSLGVNPTWSRLADVTLSGSARGAVARDANGDIWVHRGANGGFGNLNIQTNTWTQYDTEYLRNGATATIDTSRNNMLVLGANLTINENWAWLWNLDDAESPNFELDDVSANLSGYHGVPYVGLQYDSVSDQYVYWKSGASVYTIDPENFTESLVTAAATNQTVPTARQLNGTFGRFRYIPSKNVFLLVNAEDENVYFYKLTSGGGMPVDPPPVVALTANPTTIDTNNSALLTWTVSNATTCTASGDWSGNKDANGGSESTGNLTQTSTYTLSCEGLGGTRIDSATVTVNPVTPAPTVSLTATPTSVASGDTTLLTWTSTDADDCEASNGWAGTKAANNESGEASAPLNGDTTFVLTCTGAGGTGSDSAIVTVQAGVPDPIVNLSASTNNITSGGSVTLTWAPENASVCLASGDWIGVKSVAGGSQTITNLTQNSSYSLTCQNSQAVQAVETENITVMGVANPPSVTLTASPTSVVTGGTSTLTWSTTNATSCDASGDWTGTLAISGSQVQTNLTQNQSYGLTCTGAGGSAAAVVNVTVSAPLPPTVTLIANPSSIVNGGSTTLTWSTTNATSCTAGGDWSGTRTTSGSETQSNLTQSQSYTLTCTGSGGSAAGAVSVTVAPPVDSDSDNDGLPDDWEQDNFGSLGQGAAGDFDGDGATNLEEYAGGSNPTDPNSVPVEDSSGGGATGLWMLLWLNGLVWLRRKITFKDYL